MRLTPPAVPAHHPRFLPALLDPIADGEAQFTKANRFYGEGSFARPYLPEDKPSTDAEDIGGSNAGMGSLTQADATPGAEPTRKPEGGA